MAVMQDMSQIQIDPLSGGCGAVIRGVHLADDLGDNVIGEIRQALLDNQVIFFRDQEITRDQHKDFGRRFGPLNVHPQYVNLDGHPEILPILKEGDATDNIGGVWHTDLSNLDTPPLGSILYAKDAPSRGGDTMFANQYAAYEALSDGLKALLDPLGAVHSSRTLTDIASIKKRNATRSTKLREDIDEVADAIVNIHPVVRTHPETGRKAIYVNKAFTIAFEGMTEEESAPLLQYLYGHCARLEFTCRFRWEVGSIAFWDNRCVQHYAVNDYPGERRYMERVTVEGDRPR
jgi:taurine dioxygenase